METGKPITNQTNHTITWSWGEFEELVKNIRPGLHKYLFEMIDLAILSEEIVQEALLNAFYKFDGIKYEHNLRIWLIQMAEKIATEHLPKCQMQKNGETKYPPLNQVIYPVFESFVENLNVRNFDEICRFLNVGAVVKLYNHSTIRGELELRNKYFPKFLNQPDWQFEASINEGHPVIIVYNSKNKTHQTPKFFLILTFQAEKVSMIRDYRFALYVMDNLKEFKSY